MPNSTISDGGLTPLESYLTAVHGDLHQVIPDLLSGEGSYRAAVAALSDERQSVSESWIRQWLKRNGYRRVTRWERCS